MDNFLSNAICIIDRWVDVVFLSGLIGGDPFNALDDGPGCLEIVVDDVILYEAVKAAALSGVSANWPLLELAAHDFRLVYIYISQSEL